MRATWMILGLAVAVVPLTAQSAVPRPLQRTAKYVVPTGSIVIQGARIEGGASIKFTKVVDLAAGYSRQSEKMGQAVALSGFNGIAWDFVNGIVGIVDVPPQIADARARAFADRAGWRPRGEVGGANIHHASGRDGAVTYLPPGGSEVTVIYDPKTRLAKRLTIQTEYGPIVTSYADWRRVGRFRYPYRQITAAPTGLTTVVQIERVRPAPAMQTKWFAPPPAQPHGHLLLGKPARVDFTLTGARQSHILVPAKISGQDATLIFDTAGDNFLTNDAAQRLGLSTSGGVGLVGAGASNSNGSYATIDSIELGSAELRGETISVGPSPFPPGPRTDGLTGYEFLAEFRTTIDYAAKTLTFSRFGQPWIRKGVRLPYYSDHNLIYVEARIGTAKGLFRLDSGDGGTITVFPNYARQHGLEGGQGSDRPVGGGFGGGVVGRDATLPSFTFAGLRFGNLPATFSQNKAGGFAPRSIAGNLGAGVLQCFRITIDRNAQSIEFEPLPPNPSCGRGAAVSPL